jgi:hypothetical protein
MISFVNDYLVKQSITVMAHVEYSLDLALSAYWLFGFLKLRQEGYWNE